MFRAGCSGVFWSSTSRGRRLQCRHCCEAGSSRRWQLPTFPRDNNLLSADVERLPVDILLTSAIASFERITLLVCVWLRTVCQRGGSRHGEEWQCWQSGLEAILLLPASQCGLTVQVEKRFTLARNNLYYSQTYNNWEQMRWSTWQKRLSDHCQSCLGVYMCVCICELSVSEPHLTLTALLNAA